MQQQPALSEWPAPPPTGISLTGFKFSYRAGALEWRLLHGIDPDAVVKLTDVRAVEDCLQTLQQGSLDNEKALSSKNCVQLFRLLQLAIEYVWHLRNAHMTLLDAYGAAVAAAGRWKAAANLFLDTGAAFVSGCMSSGDIRQDTLEQVDVCRVQMDLMDRQYNQALDRLEDEDQRARYFHFRKQRSELNWQQLCSVDLEALIVNTDTHTLDRVLHNLVFGCITSEDREELTPHHFTQLIPLAQAALDYMMFQANATGAALERSMVSLQGACVEIPPLTAATQQLHTRITNFILEAQSQAAQLAGLTGPHATAATAAGVTQQQQHPMMMGGMMGPSMQDLTAMGMMGMMGGGSPGGTMQGMGMQQQQHAAAMQHSVQHMQHPSMVSAMSPMASMVMPAAQSGMVMMGTGGGGAASMRGSMQGPQQAAEAMMMAAAAAQQRVGGGGVQGGGMVGFKGGVASLPGAAMGYGGGGLQAPLSPLGPLLYRNYTGMAGGGMMQQQQPGSPGAAGSTGSTMIPAVWPTMPMTYPGIGGYGDVLALAATSAASAPALEMQAKAVEMHFRMEALESDLRCERSKAEEMRRMLADIRDRVVVAAPTSGGAYAAGGMGPQGSVLVTDQQVQAAGAGAARARMPSMSGGVDLLRGSASADVGPRLPAAAELRARAARQRTRGHRATQSQAASAMNELGVGDGDDLLALPTDMASGGGGYAPLGPGPSPLAQGTGVVTGAGQGLQRPSVPASMAKGRMGGRGMHRRTASTSKSMPTGPGSGGGQTPPQHSRQPSGSNMVFSGDLELN